MQNKEDRRVPMIGVGTLNISARAKELVLEALNNNRLSYGPLTERFENEFARIHTCRFGLMSNSGTSALHIALQAMKELHGWQDGDEVIVPAVTFVATVNIVLHNRMQPVLVDVDPVYYELDPELVESKITPRTRAIIPVHLFGQPADMKPIREIANRHGLKIIEDSAETMFASYDGQMVGSLGDIGCFSTYVAHLLVTGVGGINTTNNPEYAVKMRSLMNHGRDAIYLSIDDDDERSEEDLKMIIARRFNFISVGHSYRVTEMEAGLGVAQLEEWQSIVAPRRHNARSLLKKLAHLEEYLQLPKTRPGSEHSFMMFPILRRDGPKSDMVNFLEKNGVETRDMLPLTNQPVYHQILGLRESDYPIAKSINERGFYVGCHQDLAEADLDYMAELFEQFYRRQPSSKTDGSCLIILAHRDESAVERAVEEIPREQFDQVIAVDLGITDRMRKMLADFGAEIITVNGGAKGQDFFTMLKDGRISTPHENLIFFAADGRHNPRDVARLLLALERGNDMVAASRFIHGGARHDRHQRFRYRSIGNRVLTLMANLFFYGNSTDTLCTFRAVRRRCLNALPLQGGDLPVFYRLSIHAMKKGWKVAEVPTVEMVGAETGRRRKIAASVVPLLKVLFSEWWG